MKGSLFQELLLFFLKKKKYCHAGCGVAYLNIQNLGGKGSLVTISEFEASLVDRVSSRPAWIHSKTRSRKETQKYCHDMYTHLP